MIFMLKALIIGVIVAIPVGPLGLLAIQRTMSKGRKMGFLSGVGAAASDMVYSTSAVLGMGYIEIFLQRHKCLINCVTGVLFLIVGTSIIMKTKKNRQVKKEKNNNKVLADEELIHPAFTHFIMGLSNPMTFLVFVVIFAKMGVDCSGNGIIRNMLFILGIFTGSCILWLITITIVKYSKKDIKPKNIFLVEKLIGIIIALCGSISVLKGLIRF